MRYLGPRPRLLFSDGTFTLHRKNVGSEIIKQDNWISVRSTSFGHAHTWDQINSFIAEECQLIVEEAT